MKWVLGKVLGILTGATLLSAAPEDWGKVPLLTAVVEVDQVGFPLYDPYGNPRYQTPPYFEPTVRSDGASGLVFLRPKMSLLGEPPVLDPYGFPVIGNYVFLNTATLGGGGWAGPAPVGEWIDGLSDPELVERVDDVLSIAYWVEEKLWIRTLDGGAGSLLTLPIAADRGSVAIDGNGGVNVLWVDADGALWRSYYENETLTSSELSDGPIGDYKVVAGVADRSYACFATAEQLTYVTFEGTGTPVTEVVLDGALLPVEELDLYVTEAGDPVIAYADAVHNVVRVASKDGSDWSSEPVSGVPDSFSHIALTSNSAGGTVVAYIGNQGRSLRVARHSGGAWVENTVAVMDQRGHFVGVDVIVDPDLGTVVLTAENAAQSLAVYARDEMPSLLKKLERDFAIRRAGILRWPTPSAEAASQVLQKSADLANPLGWEDVDSRSVRNLNEESVRETVVELDEGKAFYRILELSD